MSKNELFFQSNDNMTNVHMITWEPDSEVLGIVQINHGVSEHIDRYDEFAKFLNSKGILVVGIDLLGHGMSTNNGNKKMYFGPNGSFKTVVADIHHALTQIKNIYPDVPYTMLGFSLGSFLTRTYMIDYPGIVDGSILVGSGFINNLKYKGAMFIVNRETKKYGDNVATERVRELSFGTYNKKFKPNRTTHDWLLKSEGNLDLFLADPLRGENLTVGLFRELLNSMLYSCNVDNINKMNKTKPIYFLSGSDDYVGDKGKGVKKSFDLFKSCGITDVDMKLYPTLRHDILHENECEQIYHDIYGWLVSKKLVNPASLVVKTEDSKVEKKEIQGLVDYDEYDIVWPEAMQEEHSITRRR